MVYVAAAYTHPDPIINTRAAIDAWVTLYDAGFIPIVPHTTLLIHLVHPMPTAAWYEYDLEILAHCGWLLRLPGASVGADREVEFAIENGIWVYTGTARDFVEWMKVNHVYKMLEGKCQ